MVRACPTWAGALSMAQKIFEEEKEKNNNNKT